MTSAARAVVDGRVFEIESHELAEADEFSVVLEDGTCVTYACAVRIRREIERARERAGLELDVAERHGFALQEEAPVGRVYVRNDWRARLARRIAGGR